MNRVTMFAAAVVLSLQCVSASMAEDKPEYSGFLDDYSGLVAVDKKDFIYDYRYVKPDTDFSTYNQVLIDAVTVVPSKQEDFKGINANDLTLSR